MTLPAHPSTVFSVTETSQVGEARRAAERITETLGFDTTRRGEVAIIITELASNLARHATGGELVIRMIPCDVAPAIEMLSIDRGPGISSLNQAGRDGFSTGGTSGTGMGAVRRLSTEFDAFSTQPAGTVIVSRVHTTSPPSRAKNEMSVGVVCLPKKGEPACGDAWHVEHLGDRVVILVADGLGHGLLAAEASRQAVRIFRENLQLDGPRIMTLLHDALRSTRGAAVAIVELRRGQQEVRFTGVGNIAGSIFSPAGMRSMVSHNGTIGAELRRAQEFVYPWPGDDALMVLHSDGLESRWQLAKYVGLPFKHPSLIAGVLYRDHRRQRDDVTALVLKSSGLAVDGGQP